MFIRGFGSILVFFYSVSSFESVLPQATIKELVIRLHNTYWYELNMLVDKGHIAVVYYTVTSVSSALRLYWKQEKWWQL